MSAPSSSPSSPIARDFYFEVTAGRALSLVQLRSIEVAALLRRLACRDGLLPVAFKAERNEDVIFCGCKHTRTGAVLRW